MNRFLLTALVLVVAVAWAAALAASGRELDASFFSPISTAVTAASVAIFLFDSWFWRAIGGLLGRPVLSGTWRGVLKSDWTKPDGSPIGDIEVVGVVTQTYSSIVFRLMTVESQSITTSAALVHELDGRVAMMGVYENTPRPGVREKSERHAGALRLLFEGTKPKRLVGPYWTDRKTFGELQLERVSVWRVHSFEEGKALKG